MVWLWIALLTVLLAVLAYNARFVRETYLDAPSTTRKYYDAGLKAAAPGLALEDVFMNISTNDLICTYFTDAARDNNCVAPLIETVTWPADASENSCLMYDATVKASDARDSMLSLYGAKCQFMKTCKWLTFTRDYELVNTSEDALFLFLNRAVFVRAPHSRLSKVLGGQLTYTWPTPSAALAISSVDDRAIDETPHDTPSLRDVIRVSDGPRATPATLYYLQPVEAAPKPTKAVKTVTITGRADVTGVASIAASLGSLWLVLYLTRDALTVQLQSGADGTRYVNVALPRPASSELSKSLQFVWNVTRSGTTVMVYDRGDKRVFLVARPLSIAVPSVNDAPPGARWTVPDLWTQYKQWSQ
jgi:hypothetical protein